MNLLLLLYLFLDFQKSMPYVNFSIFIFFLQRMLLTVSPKNKAEKIFQELLDELKNKEESNERNMVCYFIGKTISL